MNFAFADSELDEVTPSLQKTLRSLNALLTIMLFKVEQLRDARWFVQHTAIQLRRKGLAWPDAQVWLTSQNHVLLCWSRNQNQLSVELMLRPGDGATFRALVMTWSPDGTQKTEGTFEQAVELSVQWLTTFADRSER